MNPDYTVSVTVTVGLTPALDAKLDRLIAPNHSLERTLTAILNSLQHLAAKIDAIAAGASAEDQKLLSDLLVQEKATLAKADKVDGKPVA